LSSLDKIKSAFPYLLLFAYGLFMCGYFFLDDYSSHYRLFARFVFFMGIFVFPAGLMGIWKHPVFVALAAYMAYLLFSGLWSEPFDLFRLGQKFTISVYLLNFIAITHYLKTWNNDLYHTVLKGSIAVAAGAAAYSIVVFYLANPFPDTRLEGMGSLTNINEFSVVYGCFALLALGFALGSDRRAASTACLAAVAIFITFTVLGQSRTTLMALLAAIAAMLSLTLERQRTVFVGLLVLAVLALVASLPGSLEQAVERGIGLRPQMWAAVWEQAREAPLFGHGLVSPMSLQAGGHQFANAHSAYLQVFWEGGIVGLALFMALLYVSLRSAYSLGRNGGGYTVFCLLLFAILTMTTDLATLIERPRDQWMLFWFPLALLLSQTRATTPAARMDGVPRNAPTQGT